ncbi:unnamed protein product [Gadus morhua 'NCC']
MGLFRPPSLVPGGTLGDYRPQSCHLITGGAARSRRAYNRGWKRRPQPRRRVRRALQSSSPIRSWGAPLSHTRRGAEMRAARGSSHRLSLLGGNIPRISFWPIGSLLLSILNRPLEQIPDCCPIMDSAVAWLVFRVSFPVTSVRPGRSQASEGAGLLCDSVAVQCSAVRGCFEMGPDLEG